MKMEGREEERGCRRGRKEGERRLREKDNRLGKGGKVEERREKGAEKEV